MNHKEWLAKVADTDTENLSINAVAQRAGLVQTTLSRRLAGEGLTADQVIAICRAYRADVIQSLLSLEFITENDLKRPGVKAVLADATDEEIVAEVSRRLKEGRNTTAFDQPVSLSVAEDTVPDESRLAANRDNLDHEDEQ